MCAYGCLLSSQLLVGVCAGTFPVVVHVSRPVNGRYFCCAHSLVVSTIRDYHAHGIPDGPGVGCCDRRNVVDICKYITPSSVNLLGEAPSVAFSASSAATIVDNLVTKPPQLHAPRQELSCTTAVQVSPFGNLRERYVKLIPDQNRFCTTSAVTCLLRLTPSLIMSQIFGRYPTTTLFQSGGELGR